MQQRITMVGRLMALAIVALVTLAFGRSAAAQTSQAPDFTQFGFPQVVATVDFTPGQATRLEANGHRIDIPAGFLATPARFDLLGARRPYSPPMCKDGKWWHLLRSVSRIR